MYSDYLGATGALQEDAGLPQGANGNGGIGGEQWRGVRQNGGPRRTLYEVQVIIIYCRPPLFQKHRQFCY